MPVPAGWSFAAAAALPEVYLTAFVNLYMEAAVQPGEQCVGPRRRQRRGHRRDPAAAGHGQPHLRDRGIGGEMRSLSRRWAPRQPSTTGLRIGLAQVRALTEPGRRGCDHGHGGGRVPGAEPRPAQAQGAPGLHLHPERRQGGGGSALAHGQTTAADRLASSFAQRGGKSGHQRGIHGPVLGWGRGGRNQAGDRRRLSDCRGGGCTRVDGRQIRILGRSC